MLGTIGLTCAFPFAGDELYGQHVHLTLAQAPGGRTVRAGLLHAGRVRHAVAADRRDHSADRHARRGRRRRARVHRPRRLAERRAPAADRVPASRGSNTRPRRGSRETFLALEEAEHIAILQPLSDEVDRQRRDAQRQRFRTERGARGLLRRADRSHAAHALSVPPARPLTTDAGDPALPVRLFRLVKNLTADGYYTSRAGLLQELGYTGNTALARFPTCVVPEH